MDMNRMPSHPRPLAAILGLVACFFVAGAAQGQDTLSTTWAGNLGGGASEGFQVTAGCALQSFDIVLDITAPGSNWAGDMAMAVTAPNGNRIEIGGYNLGFGYVEAGPWPSSWNTSADGIFTASITDLAQYELAGAGCWLVEIMNAWNTGAVSEYALSLDLIGLCDEGCPRLHRPWRPQLQRLRFVRRWQLHLPATLRRIYLGLYLWTARNDHFRGHQPR